MIKIEQSKPFYSLTITNHDIQIFIEEKNKNKKKKIINKNYQVHMILFVIDTHM